MFISIDNNLLLRNFGTKFLVTKFLDIFYTKFLSFLSSNSLSFLAPKFLSFFLRDVCYENFCHFCYEIIFFVIKSKKAYLGKSRMHLGGVMFWVSHMLLCFGLFLFLPAGIIYALEGSWTYFECIYFMMVTFSLGSKRTILTKHFTFLAQKSKFGQNCGQIIYTNVLDF